MPFESFPGYATVTAALSAAGAAWAANPWHLAYPLPLTAVTPLRTGRGWAVRDREGRQLPLLPHDGEGWVLSAVSGGRPLALVAEWDGSALLPLAVFAEGTFTSLRSKQL